MLRVWLSTAVPSDGCAPATLAATTAQTAINASTSPLCFHQLDMPEPPEIKGALTRKKVWECGNVTTPLPRSQDVAAEGKLGGRRRRRRCTHDERRLQPDDLGRPAGLLDPPEQQARGLAAHLERGL